ncbi:MAG TPA: hypothetical protein VFM57_11385 [Thermoleophilaceae bacterium]|nr:hypothetical protein [Thermoleophilaceae bacterium]
MALSRPFLLALLGVVLLAATVFAVQNARNSGGDSSSSAQQTPAEQAAAPTPAPPAGPDALLASAFSAEVQSASFDAKLTFTSQGEQNLVQASGAFEQNGPKAMPEADVEVRVQVGSMNLSERGGFVTTGDRAWFTRGARSWAVPQSVWSEVVEARESGRAGSAADTPEINVDPRDWLSNVKSEGTERVDGVDATHISAQVDSAKAITDVVKAMSQAGEGAMPLPNAPQRLRQGGLTNGDLDVWVGEDKLLRRVTLSLSGKGDGGRPVTAELDFSLSGVNEPQEIARPAKVERGMPGGSYGQLANGVLGGVARASGLDPAELKIGVPVTNAHLKAERAVADNKKVVIFFKNPRALDDQAVADAVRSLDRRTKSVVVLTDVVENVDRYDSLIENLGVNQAPAIVVIDRSAKASLIEGYVDAESLAQVVADAR